MFYPSSKIKLIEERGKKKIKRGELWNGQRARKIKGGLPGNYQKEGITPLREITLRLYHA